MTIRKARNEAIASFSGFESCTKQWLRAAEQDSRLELRHPRSDWMMTKMLTRLAREEDGVLSFEWVLLLTLLTIGIVSGLTAARDAIIDELGDIAQAAQ